MGQTVNLLAYAFGGSNPSLPTYETGRGCKRLMRTLISCLDAVCFCGSSSVDRALAFQAKGREFEPRLPLKDGNTISDLPSVIGMTCYSFVC